MSHVATNWAFQQRGLTPIAFRILANLADCHNPANGCFPSQAFLADRCEVGRASINRHLRDLEELRLICRERRHAEGTQHRKTTRYYLAFEADFAANFAKFHVSGGDMGTDESHVSGGDMEAGGKPGAEGEENDATHVSETGEAMSPSSETVTCKEPINPLPPAISIVLEGLVLSWPNDKLGDLTRCRAALEAMTEGERTTATRLAKEVLLKLVKLKRGTPRLHRYLEDRMFAEFDGAPDIDKDGAYIITPKREEWSAWLGYIRSKWGERGVASTVKTGFFLPSTRWPEGHPKAKAA